MSKAYHDEFRTRLEKMLKAGRYTKLAKREIKNAYEKASLLHGQSYRASGEAYINHPLAVAELLAKFQFDCEVIQAALLHDTVEDENYTLQELEAEFGQNVRGLVDAVTKADSTDREAKNEAEQFEQKAQQGEDSFCKLMNMARDYPEALYIKFADRLHNLRTIDVKPTENQEQKRADTLPYIKIAHEIESHYFERELSDQCFRIHNPSKYQEVRSQYESILKRNPCVGQFLASLQSKLCSSKEFQHINGGVKTCTIHRVYYRKFLPVELTRQQEMQPGYLEHMPLLKRQIFLYRVQITYNSDLLNAPWDRFVQFFWRMLRPLGMHLDLVTEADDNTLTFCLKDDMENKMLVSFLTTQALMKYELGSPSDSYPVSTGNLENLGAKTITVLTKDKEPVTLIEGATALDFAFKLHKVVGLCAKQAYVNQRKVPFNTVLEDGNEVEIESTSGKEGGQPQYQAKVQWFNFVRTSAARKSLIMYFDSKLRDAEMTKGPAI